MQVYKTREEIEDQVGSSTVGWIGFQRKSDASKFHAGHEALISYSKENFEKTVVTFWEVNQIVYAIFRGPSYLEHMCNLPWDSTGCLDWCETQGVDYVLLPDPDYTEEFLNANGVIIDGTNTAIYEWVDELWSNNNYPEYSRKFVDDVGASRFNNMRRMQAVVIMESLRKELNLTYIASWKDGEERFVVADYTLNHLPENDNYILLDPIKSPDGIYYSSHYSLYTQDQKDLLLQIEGVVDTVGYSDTTALIIALEDLNTGSENFEVYRIDKTIGGVVGEENDFINIMFKMDSSVDSYPIYKKGVR